MSNRSRAANVPQGMIELASVFLQNLPEKPKESLSLREAVNRIRSQIQSAFAKGYSYEEVAQILNQQSINISASTLKNYVPSGRRKVVKEQSFEPDLAVKPRKRRVKQERTKRAISNAIAMTFSGAEHSDQSVELSISPSIDQLSAKSLPALSAIQDLQSSQVL